MFKGIYLLSLLYAIFKTNPYLVASWKTITIRNYFNFSYFDFKNRFFPFDYFNFHECSAHLGILAKFHF